MGGTWRGEITAQRRDGTRFRTDLSLAAAENGRLLCVCRDPSGRGRLEQAIDDGEERLNGFVDLVADWYWEMDAEYRFTLVL